MAKEKARLDFASLSGSCSRWCKDTLDALEASQFGFSLPAVEEYRKTLEKSDGEINAAAAGHAKSTTDVFEEGQRLNIGQNLYTAATPDSIKAQLGEVAAAQKGRAARYEEELKKQRANDVLCKKFADVAVPFVKQLQQSKDAVTNAGGELEKQIAELGERMTKAESKEGVALPEVKAQYATLSAAGISANPYTMLSAKDCEVQWTSYLDFLNRKKKSLEDEIQHKKLRGVTPAQMAEIDKQFKEYDANNSKDLDNYEFKACLYSLGLDYDMLLTKKTMVKFGGTETSINYDGFKNFMISQLGDTDTKDEILAGFKLINHGKDHADPKKMDMMADHDLKYLDTHAPKNKDGTYDFTKFTNDLFSR